MVTDTFLPFDLNTESLAQWLDELSTLSHPKAAHQLSQALKQLKTDQCPAEQLLPLLYNLTPLTLHFSLSLSATTPTIDSSPKTLKLTKLSMQLPRQLALLFCRLIENKQLQPSDLKIALYYALQLIGYSLRCYALCYEMPSGTLWKKCADLYKLAAASNSLSESHTSKVNEFKAQNTVAAVVKRNILFSILLPTLYKPDEINRLFQLANHYAELLDIYAAADTAEFGFCWELESDKLPQPVKKNNYSLPKGYLAIDTRRISQELQLGSLMTTLSPATQNKLTLLLSGYKQIFDSIIPGLPSRTTLIPGFAAACHYLQELTKLAKISQLSAQSRDSSDMGRSLSLMPLEHQRNVFDKVDSAFSQSTPIGQVVNILKTPNKNYCVAERRNLDCATGDVVLLYKEQHPLALGIIRQQQFNELSNSQQLLLELVPGNCTLYQLTDSGMDSFAIVIGENSDKAQMFLAGNRYSLHNPIQLTIDKTLTLTAYLESNMFFARFKYA